MTRDEHIAAMSLDDRLVLGLITQEQFDQNRPAPQWVFDWSGAPLFAGSTRAKLDEPAIVAAGGWCQPTEEMYLIGGGVVPKRKKKWIIEEQNAEIMRLEGRLKVRMAAQEKDQAYIQQLRDESFAKDEELATMQKLLNQEREHSLNQSRRRDELREIILEGLHRS